MLTLEIPAGKYYACVRWSLIITGRWPWTGSIGSPRHRSDQDCDDHGGRQAT
jgi:hypothetical protein